MSLSLKKESGIFKNSLLPADAQIGLANEIQDKLKRAIGGDTLKPFLYLAVSNFSYPGPEVFNTPFDFSVERPAKIDTGVDLFGPLPEQLAGAIAFGFQEAFILAHQRFRKGDRDQLLRLAHIGDGQHSLCYQVGVHAALKEEAGSGIAPEKLVASGAGAARETFQLQLESASARVQELEWDRDVDENMVLAAKRTANTASEHLEGVDRGQALLLEALEYPWSIDDKTYPVDPAKLLK